MSMQRILCAVDLSDLNINAANYAGLLAKGSGAEVEVVSVAPWPAYNIAFRTFHDSDAATEARIRAEHAPKLEAFAAEFFPGMAVKTTLLYGDPAAELVNYCNRKEWDVVIMATHNRKGLGRMLLGSVADAVMRRVNMPVLNAKPA